MNEYAVDKEAIKDRSGSCACCLLLINDQFYIANVGDSRSFQSIKCGHSIKSLTRDHKPNDPKERERIIRAGGSVY